MSVIAIKDSATFKGQIDSAGNNLVLATFTATWNGPSKLLAPGLLDMSTTYPDVVFLNVDVDAVDDIAQSYNVEAMPTTVFLKDGQVLDTIVGAKLDQIQADLQRFTH